MQALKWAERGEGGRRARILVSDVRDYHPPESSRHGLAAQQPNFSELGRGCGARIHKLKFAVVSRRWGLAVPLDWAPPLPPLVLSFGC